MEMSRRLTRIIGMPGVGGGGDRARVVTCSNATFVFVLFLCTIQLPLKGGGGDGFGVSAATTKETQMGNLPPGPEDGTEAKNQPENPVAQVRYRSRPVPTFQSSGNLKNGTGTNSSETDGPEPSGVPFFTVHELSSQTFERLQENVRNFLRNFQNRRSQDEAHRSQTGGVGSSATTSTTSGAGHVVRPPNVFTFKYHPVVLEGEGPPTVDDLLGRVSSRGIPSRNINDVNHHFNPYPYNPKDDPSHHPDMERHTVATIYTIGICLTIMAIGSVMFILINKCDGTSGGNYTRSVPASGGRSRITRSVLEAAGRATGAAGRQNNSNNGRSRSSRRGATRNSSNNNNNTTDASNLPASANTIFEIDAKILTDLPPSYDSLFPEGVVEAHNVVEVETDTQPQHFASSETINENNSSTHVNDTANAKASSSKVESESNGQNEDATSASPTTLPESSP